MLDDPQCPRFWAWAFFLAGALISVSVFGACGPDWDYLPLRVEPPDLPCQDGGCDMQ